MAALTPPLGPTQSASLTPPLPSVCLPAPAPAAAQQNPAAAPAKDDAQADVGGLGHRAVKASGPPSSPSASSPASALYLMGPVVSDTWWGRLSCRGASFPLRRERPSASGSGVDVGLDRPVALIETGGF